MNIALATQNSIVLNFADKVLTEKANPGTFAAIMNCVKDDLSKLGFQMQTVKVADPFREGALDVDLGLTNQALLDISALCTLADLANQKPIEGPFRQECRALMQNFDFLSMRIRSQMRTPGRTGTNWAKSGYDVLQEVWPDGPLGDEEMTTMGAEAVDKVDAIVFANPSGDFEEKASPENRPDKKDKAKAHPNSPNVNRWVVVGPLLPDFQFKHLGPLPHPKK